MVGISLVYGQLETTTVFISRSRFCLEVGHEGIGIRIQRDMPKIVPKIVLNIVPNIMPNIMSKMVLKIVLNIMPKIVPSC